MRVAMRNSRNRAGRAKTQARAATWPDGLSGFDILAGGVHGFFPAAPAPQAAGPGGGTGVRGLDRIERKETMRRIGRATIGTASLAATVWIGVPFALVFVLGCLTLG